MITGSIAVLRPPAQTTPAFGLVAGPAGQSAYQVWLAAGNTGSIGAYLASLVGATGAKGDAGATGAPGPQGFTGSAGPQGPAGATGATGAQGAAGPQGAPGATGAQGMTGSTGAAGPQGATGATGAAGTNGNTLLNGSGAPASGIGNNGDFYLDPTAQLIYGPKAAGTWPSGVSYKGNTGSTGATGGTGATGAAGPAGTNGAAGAAGTNGAAWYSGSGAPGTIPGAVNGDWYLNTTNGDLYRMVSGAWTLQMNLTATSGTVHYDTSQALTLPQQLQGRQNIGSRGSGVLAKSAAYTVLAADAGKLIACTGTFALTLPAASSVPNLQIEVANTGTGKITLTPNGSDTIRGAASLVVNMQEGGVLQSDGTNWQAVGFAPVVVSYSYGSTSNYIRWSNGYTRQWGTVASGGGDTGVTFPLAFTGAPFVIAGMTGSATSATTLETVMISRVSPISFDARPRYNNGSSTGAAGEAWNWSAEGYI